MNRVTPLFRICVLLDRILFSGSAIRAWFQQAATISFLPILAVGSDALVVMQLGGMRRAIIKELILSGKPQSPVFAE
jgi:hypothetical protein